MKSLGYAVHKSRGWKDGSATRSTCYCCRGPGLNSRHVQEAHKLTSVPGASAPFCDLSKHQTHMWYRDIHAGQHVNLKKKFIYNKNMTPV